MKLEYLFYVSRLKIFESIVNNGDTWSAQVARVGFVSCSYTAKILNLFEKAGLITRTRNWGKRNIIIQPTEKGKGVWQHLKAIKGGLIDG